MYMVFAPKSIHNFHHLLEGFCKELVNHAVFHSGSREKEGAYTLCNSMDGTGEHYVK